MMATQRCGRKRMNFVQHARGINQQILSKLLRVLQAHKHLCHGVSPQWVMRRDIWQQTHE